jgi:hypothetical protein
VGDNIDKERYLVDNIDDKVRYLVDIDDRGITTNILLGKM